MNRRRYLPQWVVTVCSVAIAAIGIVFIAQAETRTFVERESLPVHDAPGAVDYWPMVFVFLLSTFIGLGVIRRVSRLLHTPLMSLTNAISAIAVVGAILIAGPDFPPEIRLLGGIALFASVTNIVSGFLITDRMLKMFKRDRSE